MQTNLQADNGPWYKHRWPWLLMLGPALVVVAGFYTAYLAYTRQDALVVGDYYRQGKAINQDLRREARAAQLQIALQLAYDAKQQQLSGQVWQGDTPYRGNLRLRIIHPTQAEKDLQLFLAAGGDGKFTSRLAGLTPGRRQLVLEGERLEWRLSKEWLWQP